MNWQQETRGKTAMPTDPRDDAAEAEVAAARDDGLVYGLSQLTLIGLMTAGNASITQVASRGMSDPPESLWPFVGLRLVANLGMFFALGLTYRRPWFRQLRGASLIAGVAVACLVAAASDIMLFPILLGSTAPEYLALIERHPVQIGVSRLLFCIVWSTLDQMLQLRAAARKTMRAMAVTRRQATEALLALRTSELERLTQQIEPHFLFNALSAVLACREDPAAVESLTSSLADYLRFCLSRGTEPEPLGQELDAVEELLSVHEARFGESLCTSVGAEPATRRMLAPPLVLAPLVDNALKYGAETSPLPRSVAVDADLVEGQLVLTVTNSGHWVEPATEATGSGLANLKRRLELLNVAFTLDVEADDQQVAVRLTLPAGRAVTGTAVELAPQAAAAGSSRPGTAAEVADA